MGNYLLVKPETQAPHPRPSGSSLCLSSPLPFNLEPRPKLEGTAAVAAEHAFIYASHPAAAVTVGGQGPRLPLGTHLEAGISKPFDLAPTLNSDALGSAESSVPKEVSDQSVGVAAIRRAERMPKPDLHPSPGLGAWLAEMGGSLAFSTYQSSRLFFLFADDDGQTVAQERIVGSAMGLAINQRALWISNKEQVWRFSNVGPLTIKEVAWQAVYMPRKGYFLGGCDTHDILPGMMFKGRGYELAFVNTAYSCIAAVDAHYGFRPIWKPDFITALSPEDRCHLNGLGARDGELAYATLCGRFDTPIGWKAVKNGGGSVVDIRTDEVLCEGLSMPHSPRWHRDRLWLLNSGDGDFGYVDQGRFVPVVMCPGFARGLCFVGDYAVIGLSRLRDNTFATGMAIKQRLEDLRVEQRCGLIVVDLNTGKVVHWLSISGVVSELYDVGFLPGITRPYTPGFSEPDLHRAVLHPMPGVFPLAPPRPRTGDADGPANGSDGPLKDSKQ